MFKKKIKFKPSLVAQACNSSTQEAEASISTNSQDQPGLQNETLSQKKKKINDWKSFDEHDQRGEKTTDKIGKKIYRIANHICNKHQVSRILNNPNNSVELRSEIRGLERGSGVKSTSCS